MSAPTTDLREIFDASMESVVSSSKALASEAVPLLRTVAPLVASAVASRIAGMPNTELEEDLRILKERIRLAGGHVAYQEWSVMMRDGLDIAVGVLATALA